MVILVVVQGYKGGRYVGVPLAEGVGHPGKDWNASPPGGVHGKGAAVD